MSRLDDVHLDRRGRLFDAHRPEEAAEQLVDSGVGERVVHSHVVHEISVGIWVRRVRDPVHPGPTASSPICARKPPFFKPRDPVPFAPLKWDNGGKVGRPPPMSKNELTAADRARLKAELEARRAALRVEVKTQLAGSGDDGVVGLRNRIQESGDEWGVADGLAELDLAEVRHVLADLAQVDAALARMRDGTYGECADCGEPIAPARLMAYPTAQRCVSCQGAYEKKLSGPPLTAV